MSTLTTNYPTSTASHNPSPASSWLEQQPRFAGANKLRKDSMSTKPNQPDMPAQPVVCSLTLGYDSRDNTDNPLNPCIRVLATISNHYGELGSAAEFLRKAAQIRAVLERPDGPFLIRIFAGQDADDVLDASDPSEWLEVDVNLDAGEEAAGTAMEEPETELSRGEVLLRFKQVLCRSQALFEEKPKKDSDPAPRLESRPAPRQYPDEHAR